jgi:MFS family permease
MSFDDYPNKMMNWRSVLPGLTVVVTFFAWFIMIGTIFPTVVAGFPLSGFDAFLTMGIYFSSTAVSAFFGALSVRRKNLIQWWIIVGACFTILLLFVGICLPLSAFLVALLLGISVGLGLPSSLAYLADLVNLERRGATGGIVYGAIGICVLAASLITGTADYVSMIVFLAALRIVGVIPLILDRRSEASLESQKVSSFKSVLSKKSFVLYFIPWTMFCFLNWIERPILEDLFGTGMMTISLLMEIAIGGVSAFICGVLSDKIGRKRMVVGGFVVLGVAYAVLGLWPEIVASWYLYMILDGFAWGIFAAFFFIVLWADLAENLRKEKFYFVGGLPYLVAGFMSIVVRPYVTSIQNTATFSLASFFLFLAVLPLMYAPETLPEKRIKERELKGYVEKAKKTKEKYT